MSQNLNGISGESPFDQIKHVTAKGGEYWRARELATALEYADWTNFENVIGKAQTACVESDEEIDEHFRDTTEVFTAGQGATGERRDLFLIRYGCYLIAMNGDPRKKVIAEAQTYFAKQTRKQEILDSLTEEQKRIFLRNRVKSGIPALSQTAHESGVEDFARFHNAGYQGLYGGWGVGQLKKKKGVPAKHDYLDCINREELAANEFRIAQTDKKLKEDRVQGEDEATQVHYNVGKKVRKAIIDIGGTMPENLPAEPNIATLLKKPENKAFAMSLKGKKPEPELLPRPIMTPMTLGAKWQRSTRVVVAGVSGGVLTEDGSGYQNFEDLDATRELFPDLDTHKDTARFTRAIGNPERDPMRFEIWAAFDLYSE